MSVRVLVLRVGQRPSVETLEPDGDGRGYLTSLQRVVGGYVDCVVVDGTDVWCNDEGLILGLPLNRELGGHRLHGDLVLAGHDGRGNTVGLTDDQLLWWLVRLKS